jgi:rod shape determining protein RodA
MSLLAFPARDSLSLGEKLRSIRWSFVALLAMVAGVGVLSLYSAAGGDMEPWAGAHSMRFGLGLVAFLVAALIDIRIWMQFAYVIYGAVALMLVYVDISGHIGMGAQRWINLGFIAVQPSELMKIAIILALARFFHGATVDEVRNPLFLIRPLLLVALPVALVAVQPDLGPAVKLILASGAIFWLAGVSYWMFGLVVAGVMAALPIIWSVMHDYQKKRVLTFLDPSSDPLGAGYHITQSKIAIGSGGITGKGYLKGTQSSLD